MSYDSTHAAEGVLHGRVAGAVQVPAVVHTQHVRNKHLHTHTPVSHTLPYIVRRVVVVAHQAGLDGGVQCVHVMHIEGRHGLLFAPHVRHQRRPRVVAGKPQAHPGAVQLPQHMVLLNGARRKVAACISLLHVLRNPHLPASTMVGRPPVTRALMRWEVVVGASARARSSSARSGWCRRNLHVCDWGNTWRTSHLATDTNWFLKYSSSPWHPSQWRTFDCAIDLGVRVRRNKVVTKRINDQHDGPLEPARQCAAWYKFQWQARCMKINNTN